MSDYRWGKFSFSGAERVLDHQFKNACNSQHENIHFSSKAKQIEPYFPEGIYCSYSTWNNSSNKMALKYNRLEGALHNARITRIEERKYDDCHKIGWMPFAFPS